MELKTAIEILEYYQQWRLGKKEDMIHEAKKLTEALDMVILEVKKISLNMEEKILKELLKEMELRVVAFEKNMGLLGTEMYHYWNGKRSEAAFMVDKLTWILENKSGRSEQFICDHPMRSREYYSSSTFKCWQCGKIP